MPVLNVAMYLDAAEEKMLRAIVHSAIASAAAGCPFAGEFRHYRISATCLQVNEQGIARVEARIVLICIGTSDRRTKKKPGHLKWSGALERTCYR